VHICYLTDKRTHPNVTEAGYRRETIKVQFRYLRQVGVDNTILIHFLTQIYETQSKQLKAAAGKAAASAAQHDSGASAA
jgi:hypothetical protein